MNLIIDIGVTESRGLLISEENPKKIYIQDHLIKNISGNIYKGRVENILSSLECAFVKIGENKMGMLHFDDCTSTLNKGDEVLVQVTREPIGDKGPRLSMSLSIPSKNSVLLVGCKEINISRKIKCSTKRKELYNLGKSLTKGEKDLGVILRTSCEDLSSDEIEEEFSSLKKDWDKIERTWKYIKGEALLFNSSDFLNYIKREYINPNIENIYINREYDKKEIQDYINENNLKAKIHLVEEGVDRLHIIKESITYALSRKFDIKGGGNIVVDETEALTIVDVNSASSNNNEREENFISVNLGAAEKVAEVLSLRSSSGIILIDFINMKEKTSRQEVENEVIKKFQEYNINAKVHGFTQLGILEISRAKKSKPLRDIVYFNKEEKIESPLFSLKNLENDLLSNYYKKTNSSFKVNVSDEIHSEIEKTNFIKSIKDIYSINIEVFRIKGFKGYYILENNENDFARISIGKRNCVGKIDELIEDEKSLVLKINKIN